MNKLPWLKHDAQASNDSWLRNVVRKQGPGAGWVWWGLCEQLHTHGIGNKFTRNMRDIAAYSCVKTRVLVRVLDELGRVFEGEQRLTWKKNGENIEVEIKNYRKLQEKFGRKTPSKPPENPPKTPTDKIRIDKSRVDKKQLESMFDKFWAVWPKKEDRQNALKVFMGLAPSVDLHNKIIAAIVARASSDDWKKEGGQFIPGPAKWLRGKRWEDIDDIQKTKEAILRNRPSRKCVTCYTSPAAPFSDFCEACAWCQVCDDEGKPSKKSPKDLMRNTKGGAICKPCFDMRKGGGNNEIPKTNSIKS